MDNINTQGEFKSNDSEDQNFSFDLESMSPEERQRVEEELKTELAKVSFKHFPLHYSVILVNMIVLN